MQTIAAKELKQRMNEGDMPLLVDVLPADHFEKEHLPGATNAPVDQDGFEKTVERIAGHKDRELVVYCANHECDASPRAAKKLEAAGFENVVDFEGGIADWKEAGYTTGTGS